MTDITIDERISELHRQLAELQNNYQIAARPIIDELVYLESQKPPKPIFIEWPEGQEPPLMVRHLVEEIKRITRAAT